MQRIQHHLTVAGASETHAFVFELPAQFQIVVDLAVVDQHPFAVGGRTGLTRVCAQIDDAQAQGAEPDRSVDPNAVVIRPPMREAIHHLLERSLIRGSPRPDSRCPRCRTSDHLRPRRNRRGCVHLDVHAGLSQRTITARRRRRQTRPGTRGRWSAWHGRRSACAWKLDSVTGRPFWSSSVKSGACTPGFTRSRSVAGRSRPSCAPANIGHLNAESAPPSSVMNSRRFI